MSPAPHVVTPETVRQIAGLARLRVPDAELDLWSEQLSRIVGYIDQLKQIPEEAFAGEAPSGYATPLREDSPRDGHGPEALEPNAPRLIHGYGVVPRVVGSGS
jgi:aspartyl-tRNA(Asn)/glutamyl-tRNA(Gln) amidotransferase subunit C